jgi:hypothetical protein
MHVGEKMYPLEGRQVIKTETEWKKNEWLV